MASKVKLKLLYIKQYLEKYSDENNPVSAEELSQMLLDNGIECERKSIYSDVKALKDYGVDIFRVRAPKNGYYVGERSFELPEVRLLIDAVRSANFITAGKTETLINKIGSLCSNGQFEKIQNQVFIENSVKCTNEEIYYNIDVLNRAIENGKKVKLIYSRRKLNVNGSIIDSQRREHIISPYALLWNDDHYYLIGNNAKYDNIMHLRIDRMKRVEILSDDARDFKEVSPYEDHFDAADYSSKLFNMFSGEISTLELICDNSILEEMLDRFGQTAVLKKCPDENHFSLSVNAVISDGLAGWLMNFSDKVTVASPDALREKIIKKAEEIRQLYNPFINNNNS